MLNEDVHSIEYGNVSILILLDYLFLLERNYFKGLDDSSFNPYFIGLPILIITHGKEDVEFKEMVSILILLDYLFLSVLSRKLSIYYCYRIFFRH